MKKPQFLKTIQERNETLLNSLLFQNNLTLIDITYDIVADQPHKVWIGDLIYAFLRKKKITEEDVLFLFSLKNQAGKTWLDFISYHKNLQLCLAVLALILILAKENLLSRAYTFKILFETSDDQWNFVIAIARYFEKGLVKLLSLFEILASTPEGFHQLLHGLMLKVGGDWTFIHFLCLAERGKNKGSLVASYLTFFKEKTRNSSDAKLLQSLLTAVSHSERLTAIHTLFNTQNDQACSLLFEILIKIYSLEGSLLSNILIPFSSTQYSLSRLPLAIKSFTQFIEFVYEKDNSTLPILVDGLLVGTKDFSLFRESVNTELEERLLILIKQHLRQLLRGNDQFDLQWILALLFMPNKDGWNYCHLSAMSRFSRFSIAIEIINLIVKKYKNKAFIVIQYMLMETIKEAWSILSLLVRYDQSEVLSKQVCQLLFSEEYNLALRALTKTILTYDKAKPFVPHLVVEFRSLEFCQFFFNKLKAEIVNQRDLSNMCLTAVMHIYPTCKQPQKAEWLLIFANEMIEKTYIGLLDVLSLTEKNTLEFFAKVNVASAHYLLHKCKHSDTSKLSTLSFYPDLDKACILKFNLACIEKCIINPKQIIEFFKDMNEFACAYRRAVKYIAPPDNLKLLNAALEIYKKAPVIKFLIGDYHYTVAGNPQLAANYFNTIPYSIESLDKDLHANLVLFYGHLFHITHRDVYFYLAYKHYQLALKLGYSQFPGGIFSDLNDSILCVTLLEIEQLGIGHGQAIGTQVLKFIARLVEILCTQHEKITTSCLQDACHIAKQLLGDNFNAETYHQFVDSRKKSKLLFFTTHPETEIAQLLTDLYEIIKKVPPIHVQSI